MEEFKNPANTEEILQDIRSCPTLGDVYNLAKKTFPNWIKVFIQEYSYDYPHLQSNWKVNTAKIQTKPAHIIVVRYSGVTEDYSLINSFSDIFTACGFLVRSEDEIETCSVCNRAIPGEAQYNEMKERGLQVPQKWDTKCVTC